jgi:hypothetical protein
MGSETANVHLGTAGAAPRILRHLNKQKADWFTTAVGEMTESVNEDWQGWKKTRD